MRKRGTSKPKSRGRAGSRSERSTQRGALDLRPALRAVGKALAGLGAPSMIIGGVAAIAQGAARLTTDIDATVLAGVEEVESLVTAFRKAGVSPRQADAEAFARENRVLLLRHDTSGVEIDLSIAGLSFEERALGRAELRELGGIKVRVAHPTDLIIYKMVAHRTRDLDDAEAMVRLHRNRIDFAEVDASVREFARLLEDAAPEEAWAEVRRRSADPR